MEDPKEIALMLWQKYFTERKKHTSSKWLNFKAMKERWTYSQNKNLVFFNETVIDGFKMDLDYQNWLQQKITSNNITKSSLKESVVLIKNLKQRSIWRNDYMPIITALFFCTTGLFNLMKMSNSLILVIFGIFTLFLLIERAMLNDVKSAAEELIIILDAEIVRKEVLKNHKNKAA